MGMARAIGAACEILPSSKMWKKEQNLPITSPEAINGDSAASANGGGLRKRFSASFSNRSDAADFTDSSSAAAPCWGSYIRSKSMGYVGLASSSSESLLQSWWRWGLDFIACTRKLIFGKMSNVRDRDGILGARDLRSGTLGHVFYKIRAKVRGAMNSSSSSNSQPFRYDALSYAKNFDDGPRNAQIQNGYVTVNGARSY